MYERVFSTNKQDTLTQTITLLDTDYFCLLAAKTSNIMIYVQVITSEKGKIASFSN